MTSKILRATPPASFLSRRGFFAQGTRLTLSGTAVALLAGAGSLAGAAAAQAGSAEADVNILNSALGAEREAIAAYQVGAESGLLSEGVLAVAVQFQGHHKEHAELLAQTIETLGGKPAPAP